MRRTVEIRFWAKVRRDGDGCWEWFGSRRDGYGLFWVNGHHINAHIFAYESTNGAVPDGLCLDHLCRNRGCVNPKHLEPVTIQENCARGETGHITGARKRARTHCSHGHPYSPENTYVSPQGYRVCKVCRRLGQHERLVRRKSQGDGKGERYWL